MGKIEQTHHFIASTSFLVASRLDCRQWNQDRRGMPVGTQHCVADLAKDMASGIACPSRGVWRGVLTLLLMAACGFPRPRDVGDDAPGDSGTPVDPAAVIHVSPSGDDTNDGHTQPVKTIKRAIDIAAADAKVAQIALAAGSYSASSGEAFPYVVPSNVALVGPVGGGAVLSGGKMTGAFTVATGSVQDLDLQDFTTAISATEASHVQNVKIETSAVAIQAETTAVLTVNDLTISGTLGACGTGIILNGGAALIAKNLETHNLQTTLDMRDQSSADVSNATLAGDLNCSGNGSIISVTSTASFRITDSVLDGGKGGIGITPKSPNFQAVLTNTHIRNMRDGALGGGFGGVSASFHMVGGELSNSSVGSPAVSIGPGVWTFTGVTFHQNKGFDIYLQDGSLVMRGCTLTESGGIDVFVDSTADLGTRDSPGNNVFQNNGVSLVVESSIGVGGVAVQAVGNTWNPKVQNADDSGKYAVVDTISGPVTAPANGNYSVNSGCKLTR